MSAADLCAAALWLFALLCWLCAKRPSRRRGLPMVLAAASAMLALGASAMVAAALARGATAAQALGAGVPELAASVAAAEPDGGGAPEVLPGEAVVLFRWGCPDCEGAHDRLVAWAESCGADVRWVDSRSEAGRAIVAEWSVPSVPWVVWVDDMGEAGSSDASDPSQLPAWLPSSWAV